MIPYGRQSVDQNDIDAVVEILRSDWLTQGPTVERFERAVADHVEARHAIAYSSGTAALHGAAFAAGWGPGDTVVTSPLTFMASANCARYVGAQPALVDIERTTFNIDLEAADADVAGVVPVHYAGLPVDLRRLETAAVVVEDGAHALGASTPDGPVGNCAQSSMCCFSFHPVKPITTAEGGIVTTNDDDLADGVLLRFRSHGIVRRPERGGWYYDIGEMGYNYRLADLQAALGLSQMAKLDRFIARRNEIADRYRHDLADLPIELAPSASDGFLHGYHIFPVLVEDRRSVYDALRDRGVATQVHYVPIHHHPISADIGLHPGDLPVCDEVYDHLLTLPIYPELTDADLRHVVESLEQALDG